MTKNLIISFLVAFIIGQASVSKAYISAMDLEVIENNLQEIVQVLRYINGHLSSLDARWGLKK